MNESHKNKARASLRPLNAGTLALSTLGIGFLRPAPGTWGSMPPAIIAFIMLLSGTSYEIYTGVILAVLVLSCGACLAYGRYAETRFGRKDAAEVVSDETAGQCLPLLLWPSAFHTELVVRSNNFTEPFITACLAVASAFLLFRFMDIIKPQPARFLERLPYGWGVLLDDLIAGLYATIILQLALRLLIKV